MKIFGKFQSRNQNNSKTRCWVSFLNSRAETKIFKEEWLDIFDKFQSIDQNI